MKKFFLLIIFSLNVTIGVFGGQGNVFYASDTMTISPPPPPDGGGGPVTPGGPAANINKASYAVTLMLLGAGLIVYTERKKNKVKQSKKPINK